MNRSQYVPFGHMSKDAVMFQGSVRGAAAAPPTITPAVYSATSAIQYMAASDNFIASTARSGVGICTYVLKDSVPVMWDVDVNVWGTDGKQAQVLDYNPNTRTLSVNTFAAGGAPVDLATTDNLRFTFLGAHAVSPY